MTEKRTVGIVAALVAITAVAIGVFAAREPLMLARIATAYCAKTVCSCLHVASRPLASCMSELPADALERVSVSVKADRVIATALGGLIFAHAVHEPGYGCAIIR